jgi:opacity protein-like surface antigen
MTLGLEYKYTDQFNNPLFTQTTPRDDARDQSVTLRFDFLLN